MEEDVREEVRRKIVLRYYMERIMNEENDWDCNVERDDVEGKAGCASRDEVMQALSGIKI